MKFSDLALRAEILKAVDEAGYEQPTPIQEQAIPAILTGGDVLGIAQTGTGKTAAFVLPMIERLASGQSKARMPRSLILSPTRELATQTASYFETYGKYIKLNMALLIGGVGMDEQWKKLERGVDVLIATPGRLLDQFERGKVLLGGVTILVIDEADRMLDMGFIPDVERLASLVSKRRQTLFFSATMPPEVRRLADNFLIEPVTLQATPPATKVDQISDHLTVVQPRQKFKVLRRLIETQDVGKAIIFCNRKREVSALRRQLERVGHSVRDIHGDLDQSQRTQALDAFKQGEIDFLVATDVAARGIDIAMLPCVINYDVPIHADDYVHRIGRTGRAGQLGRAYTLAFADETKFVDAITKLTGKAIPVLEIPGVAPGALEESAKGGRRRGRKAKPAVTETTDQSSGPDQAAPAKPARSRRAKAEPAVDAVDAEVAAAEAAPQPAAEDDAPARPRRRRSRRGAKAEAPAAPEPEVAEQDDRAEVEAAEEPVEAPASEASTPRDDARGGNGRGRRRRGRDEGGKEAAPARGRRGASNPPDRPVVGMGDHVPLFMQRPVPISRKASDAIDSNDSID